VELLTVSAAKLPTPDRCIAPLLAVAAALLAGCVVTPPAPPVDPATLPDTEFLNYLADRPLVSVDEACRAVLILTDGTDESGSFQQRFDKLQARGIVRPAWKLRPDQAVDKGTVAYMVMRGCRIPGGVNAHLFGSWGLGDRRYAVRELMFENLLPEDAGSDYQLISGGEFIGLLHKADQYLQERATEHPELPPTTARAAAQPPQTGP
jgi:hypothetical protein